MTDMKMVHVLFLAAAAALWAPEARAAPGLPALVTAVPAVSQWSLGLVADGRRTGEEGVRVLAVSPGGTAERLGIVAGDRLVAVNGQSLSGVQAPNALFERVLAQSGGEVRLDVLRDGTAMTLAGRADQGPGGAPGPAQSVAGCGWVTDQGVQPRVSRGIFNAEITQINGESTPLHGQNRHRTEAGRNVLVVRELIDRHRISRADTRRIQRMQNRESVRAYKVLVVDVEPGMRYSVGARLLPDRMDPDSIRANAYWEPVVWETRPEACN